MSKFLKVILGIIINALLILSNNDSVLAQSSHTKALNYIDSAGKKLRIHEYDEAIKNAKAALEIEPNNSFALMYLSDAFSNKGLLLSDEGDYKGAIIDFTYAIDYEGMNSSNTIHYIPICETYYNRAVCKNMLELYGSAILDFDKALELKPGDKLAYYNRGVAKFHEKDFTGACSDFKSAYNLGYKVSPDLLNECN